MLEKSFKILIHHHTIKHYTVQLWAGPLEKGQHENEKTGVISNFIINEMHPQTKGCKNRKTKYEKASKKLANDLNPRME
jgi:hypothetical protein